MKSPTLPLGHFEIALREARREQCRIKRNIKALQVLEASISWDIIRYEDAIKHLTCTTSMIDEVRV
jgi:hypothetical protein